MEPIRIIATGGTIDKIYFDALSDYRIGSPMIGSILEEANIATPYVVQSLLKKDSLELDNNDRKLLFDTVAGAEEKRILVTHGTDTMVESATFLSSIQDKVIVFTGSMSPAGFRSSDAIFNVGTAFAALQLAKPGVYIAMNGLVFDADKAKKDRAKKIFVDK